LDVFRQQVPIGFEGDIQTKLLKRLMSVKYTPGIGFGSGGLV
jgi:hypothetical protein